jgi:hypothetical protein
MSLKENLFSYQLDHAREVTLFGQPPRAIHQPNLLHKYQFCSSLEGRPLIVSFDFHGTLSSNPTAGRLDIQDEAALLNSLRAIREVHPETVAVINTSGRHTVSPIPGVHLLEGGGMYWTPSDTVKNIRLRSPVEVQKWIETREKIKSAWPKQPKSGVSCDIALTDFPLHNRDVTSVKDSLEGFFSKEESEHLVIINRRKKLKIRPRFEKSEGLALLAERLGYDPKNCVYLHFGDDLTDIPVDPIPSNDFYLVAGAHSDIIHEHASAIVHQEFDGTSEFLLTLAETIAQ